MRRREFLVSAAAGAAAVAGFSRSIGALSAQQIKPAVLDRISIMSLNFQNILKVPDVPASPDRTLEFFDYAQMIADTYKVHKVEFQHYHLASTEPSYLRDLRASIEKAKSQLMQINLEFSDLNMSAPRQRDRILAIDLTREWVNHAAALGAKRVMINQGGPQGQPTQENKVYSIPVLKTMVEYGKSKGIMVTVETRGGGGGGRGRVAGPGGATGPGAAAATAPAPPPAPPAAPAGPPPLSGRAAWTLLAEIIQAAGSYSNVDVGGAGAANQQELHDCLRTMAPFTAGQMHTRVSANWDLATAMRYLENDLKWRGLYTIETGQGHAGTKEIYDVVVKTLSELA